MILLFVNVNARPRLSRALGEWVRKVTTAHRVRLVCYPRQNRYEGVGWFSNKQTLQGYCKTLRGRVLVADDVLRNEGIVVLFSHDPNVSLKCLDDAVMPRMDVDVVHL